MKILGIFRGFPGLGRVVAGVSLLEDLRDRHGHEVKFISYLQGKKYLEDKGYHTLPEVGNADYCSIGILPTNKFAVHIFDSIKSFSPDLIVIDGEPLMLHSIKISFPDIKTVALLNPSDVDNPRNDMEAMAYFNELYAKADIAIVHGLRKICFPSSYNYSIERFFSVNTIVRNELITLKNKPRKDIYCVLGGGTINVSTQFEETTLRIAQKVINSADALEEYVIHIVCASRNIFDAIAHWNVPSNVILHDGLISASDYYKNASLIITRAGRNTTSELAFLCIPAITCVAGDMYRIDEQVQNISSLTSPSIKPLNIECTIDEFINTAKELLNDKPKPGMFAPGNEDAISHILRLLNKS